MMDAFICDGIRTPIGRYGGALSSVRTDDLAALPITELIKRNPGVDAGKIEDVIYGSANQAGEDNRNVARMAGLLAGLPETVAGVTVNRLCGSGMDAVGQAARAINVGAGDLYIAGGVESMSRAPLVMAKAEVAFSRKAEIYDTTIGWRFVNKAMEEKYGTDSMPETAENVAERFKIGRADQDAFAFRSQQRYKAALANGFFESEIMPVHIPRRRGDDITVSVDEHPRTDTSLESLGKLKTPFRDKGTVTAGNASGVNDGAAAILIASEKAARAHKLEPRARIVAMAVAGVEPRIMGMGPVSASRKVLLKSGLRLSGMDAIELNEAFAAQALACLRELKLADDADFVNANGGAIALGHPLGMSGARLVLTLVNQLEQSQGRYGLATMCIGVGQGIAMIIERV